MTLQARLADTLLDLPARSEIIFRIARRIVDRHRGENDYRMERNGELRLLREVLPDCHVVFDVGANVGEWALHALAINSAIDLHCFEPAPAAFATLQKAVPRARLQNVGLGSKAGTLSLNIYGGDSTLNSFYERKDFDIAPVEKVAVPVVTLDDYASDIPMIDFLKIDTEGHERDVLQGARKLLAEKRIGMIQFEYGSCYIQAGALLKDVWALLGGYRICKILPHRLLPLDYDQSLENHQLTNYLAMLDSSALP
jgi:FkbM family methyltransferase